MGPEVSNAATNLSNNNYFIPPGMVDTDVIRESLVYLRWRMTQSAIVNQHKRSSFICLGPACVAKVFQ